MFRVQQKLLPLKSKNDIQAAFIELIVEADQQFSQADNIIENYLNVFYFYHAISFYLKQTTPEMMDQQLWCESRLIACLQQARMISANTLHLKVEKLQQDLQANAESLTQRTQNELEKFIAQVHADLKANRDDINKTYATHIRACFDETYSVDTPKAILEKFLSLSGKNKAKIIAAGINAAKRAAKGYKASGKDSTLLQELIAHFYELLADHLSDAADKIESQEEKIAHYRCAKDYYQKAIKNWAKLGLQPALELYYSHLEMSNKLLPLLTRTLARKECQSMKIYIDTHFSTEQIKTIVPLKARYDVKSYIDYYREIADKTFADLTSTSQGQKRALKEPPEDERLPKKFRSDAKFFQLAEPVKSIAPSSDAPKLVI